MRDRRNLWLAIGAAFIIAYAAVTPPFQGPDEVAHFWRSYALARGSIVPAMEGGRPAALVPRGVRDVVHVLWVNTAGRSGAEAKIGAERLRAAMRVPLSRGELVSVRFPAQYTPIPYVPQAIGCLIGDVLHLRPLITFYLGRLLNAAFALGIIALVVWRARDPWPFLAIALLPMLLYLSVTYSPDALTNAIAFAVIALAGGAWWMFVAASLLLALCKPAYVLIPFLAVARWTDRRALRAAVLCAAVGIGALVSAVTVRHNYYAMRTDVPVSPAAQAVNVRNAPLHFAGIAAHDYRANWYAYLDQFVGHLGWLDVQLPHALIDGVLILLLLIALTTPPLPLRDRLLALAIVLATLLLVSLSQYLAWTSVGAETIEGMQGRYFLPLGPLLVMLLSITGRLPKLTRTIRWIFLAALVLLNGVAVAYLAQRYW